MVVFACSLKPVTAGPIAMTATNHCYFYNKLIIEFLLRPYLIFGNLFQVVVIVMAHCVMFMFNISIMAAYKTK